MAEGKKDGVEKAAMLLLSMGEDLASDVMKYLSPTEVQRIGSQMTKIEGLSHEALNQVVKDFEGEMQSTISSGGSEYVKKVLTKALGSDKAATIIDRIIEGGEGGGLETLRWMEPKVVADLIRNEHPQTIAVIVSYLEPEHAARVIAHFQPRTRANVVMRVATMESISPGALKELEEAVKQRIAGSVSAHTRFVGGIKMAAEILNQMDTSSETAIISEIEKNNAEVSTKIQEQMFVFADIIGIDDRGMQTILKEISNDILVLALKVASDELKEKFFKNMSERASEMLKEDMETKGPVKLSEVEKAQQEIVKTVKRLEQEGKIVTGGKGGEEQLV
ncbi:MAG: flagellar motor switch protein FliG [Deltaproteobacteria bacterium]|nr:flagellar motor switch protein FliG [Deltaproteobacteria bacterium]